MWKDKDEDEEYEEVALSFKSSLNRDTILYAFVFVFLFISDTIVAHQQDMPTEGMSLVLLNLYFAIESITTSVNSNMSISFSHRESSSRNRSP